MFFIILFSFSLSLYAIDEYVYYSGESSGDSDEKILKEEAYQNALRNLILENFGANINVEDGSTDKINYGRVFIDSPMVSLKGLSVFKSEFKAERAYVLLRISKADLKRAKLSSSHLANPLIRENMGIGKLSLEVFPYDSAVTINGIPVVDTNKIALQIGIKHKITVRHQDYLTEELEIILSDEDLLIKAVHLKSIPSKVSVVLNPPDANLYIDDVKQPPLKTEFYLEAGKHEIHAEKKGHFDEEIDIAISPNAKTAKEINLSLKTRTLQEKELSLEYQPIWASVGYQLVNPLNIGACGRFYDVEYGLHMSFISSDWGANSGTYKLHSSLNSIADYNFTTKKYLYQSNKLQLGFGGILGSLTVQKSGDPEFKESISTWYVGALGVVTTQITNDMHLKIEGGVIWGDFKERNFSEKVTVGIGWSY